MNTNNIDLESGSSQYLYASSSSSLGVTGDLTIEAYLKPESLPALGERTTILSKWDEQNNKRSYLFDIKGSSSTFGDGSDGNLTISTNTTDAPIDSACTGTSGTNTLSATNASFAAGQKVMVWQTYGTGAGTYEIRTIQTYSAGTITLTENLTNSFYSGAQVLVLKQYNNVTVNAGVTWTVKAWNGSTGGILAFLAGGTVTITGTINGTGKGFSGAAYNNVQQQTGWQGSSYAGSSAQNISNNNGGGGGGAAGGDISGGLDAGGAGGGGYATAGGVGLRAGSPTSSGGGTYGVAALTTLFLGSGGGSGGTANNSGSTSTGGEGGAAIMIYGSTITVTGSILATGGAGDSLGGAGGYGGTGGGSGGSIIFKCQTGTLGSSLVTAGGGAYGTGNKADNYGGAGGSGRIHIDYYNSYTGTTTPTIDATQDSTITADNYALRLLISSDGTNEEEYSRNTSFAEGSCVHVAAVYDSGVATTTFYKDGISLGDSVKTLTSIHLDTAQLIIGGYKNSLGNITGFYDGYLDDIRIWNITRDASEILTNYQRELAGNEGNLKAYWKFNNSYADSTGNGNTLSVSGTPVFTSNVCFSDSTTTSTSTTSTSTSTTSTSTSRTTSTSSSTSRTTSTSTTSTSTSTTSTSTSQTTTSTSTTSTSSSTSTTTSTSTSTTTTLDLSLIVEQAK